MKKWRVLAWVLALAVVLSACGTQPAETTAPEKTQPASASSEETKQEETQPSDTAAPGTEEPSSEAAEPATTVSEETEPAQTEPSEEPTGTEQAEPSSEEEAPSDTEVEDPDNAEGTDPDKEIIRITALEAVLSDEGGSASLFMKLEYMRVLDFYAGSLDGENIVYILEDGSDEMRPARVRLFLEGKELTSLEIDFCEEPLRFCVLDGFYYSGFNKYAILGDEKLCIVTADVEAELVSEVNTYGLPQGVTADDVQSLSAWMDGYFANVYAALITWGKGAFYLDEESGRWMSFGDTWFYQPQVKDGRLLVECSERIWEIPEAVRESGELLDATDYTLAYYLETDPMTPGVFCRYRFDAESGELSEEVTAVDYRDWIRAPRVICEDVLLAPRQDALYFYRLNGTVRMERQIDDLTDREDEILAGERLELYNGEPLQTEQTGFRIDLDQDGVPEEITIRPGIYKDGTPCGEIFCDGLPCGYTRMVKGLAVEERQNDWPDEGCFKPESGYKLSLASPDGEKINLVLSNDETVIVLEIVQLLGDDMSRTLFASAKMVGEGKSPDDLQPGRSLKEYVADGWTCRPSDGDRIDLNDDGKDDTLTVQYIAYGSPFYEEIWINKEPDVWSSAVDLGWEVRLEEWGYTIQYRYDRLFYVIREDGTVILRGEIMLGGEQHTQEYTVMP